MVEIKGTAITMVRGDTAKISVTIDDYTIQPEDRIRFAVKKKYTDTDVLIEKVIDNTTGILQIDPEDTKPLGMGESKGKYVYDIEITQADGTVDTFIRGSLLLLEEVE